MDNNHFHGIHLKASPAPGALFLSGWNCKANFL